MKILITGGAGYIGSVLTPMLLQEGHEVTIIDNFMYNHSSLLDCCQDPKLKIYRGDVRDKKFLEEQVKQADVILPLVCLSGAALYDKEPQNVQAIYYDAIKMI